MIQICNATQKCIVIFLSVSATDSRDSAQYYGGCRLFDIVISQGINHNLAYKYLNLTYDQTLVAPFLEFYRTLRVVSINVIFLFWMYQQANMMHTQKKRMHNDYTNSSNSAHCVNVPHPTSIRQIATGENSTYSFIGKWQECARMGLNGFIFKKINEN